MKVSFVLLLLKRTSVIKAMFIFNLINTHIHIRTHQHPHAHIHVFFFLFIKTYFHIKISNPKLKQIHIYNLQTFEMKFSQSCLYKNRFGTFFENQ